MPKNPLISFIISRSIITIQFLVLCPFLLFAQVQPIKGKIIDASTGEAMASVSIVVYQNGKLKGTVTNRDGMFSIAARTADSARFSIVGYESCTISNLMSLPDTTMLIQLKVHPAELQE